MSLLQAFQETLDGKEDRSGITAVDVYTASVLEDAAHSRQDKLNEARRVIDANLPDAERKWFLLTGVINRWGLASEALSESIREKVADSADPLAPVARYYALRAMGAAAGGLLPVDVLNEESLRESQPKLWAELFLSAYRNGSPAHITKHLVELLVGDEPLMPWKSLRALFPEIRNAYGSPAEFRKQVQIIASSLGNPIAREEILRAADKRVGGGMSGGFVKMADKKVHRKQFNIPSSPIRLDKGYSQKYVAPNGQLAVVTM